ncbi:MAG: ferrous iron transporter B [Bacillota bacterium]
MGGRYDPDLEAAIGELEGLLKRDYGLGRRGVALLLLQGDEEALEWVSQEEEPEKIAAVVDRVRDASPEPVEYRVAMARKALADRIVLQAVSTHASREARDLVGRACENPLTGIPILGLILYFGLYRFVGGFGAGTVVNYIEEEVFEGFLNPFFTDLFQRVIPWPALADLLVGEFGIFTMGLRYSVAIILPVVAAFFLVLAVIEDSGYMPRMALLVDRVFRVVGLNGRAVIPMTLGFGCDTMATVVSRTLETRRERIIATLLLALAIPCSAQLGVILGVLSGYPTAVTTWALAVLGVFILVGYLAAQVLPGERPVFYMELPPMRVPLIRNLFWKTWARVYWYFLEVIPFFILASVLLWLGDITGVFGGVISGLEPVVALLGLPAEASEVFIMGFFRRDYGAAGLYDMGKAGFLSGRQLTVSAITLTLFVPCVAQMAIMFKERGARVALALTTFIFVFAFVAGWAFNTIFEFLGVTF